MAAGCSSTNTTTPGSCTPGEREACTCVGGVIGSQRCLDDSSGFDECDCGADGGLAGQGGAPGAGGLGGLGGGAAGMGATGGADAGDCVDTNFGVEICDGVDNDCDGTTDGAPVCLPGCVGELFQGKAYAFCSVPRDWSDARQGCVSQSMTLVRIDDMAENEWLESRFQALGPPFAGTSDKWIGGSDRTEEGKWRWEDGTLFWDGDDTGAPAGGLYSNWGSGEPNDSSAMMMASEDCAVVSGAGRWNDLLCETNHAFVCEQL